MERSLRIGLAGLNQTPLDWKSNMARIRACLGDARALGIQLLCFPELVVSGYGCEDGFLHPDTADRALNLVSELAREVAHEILLVGLPFRFEGDTYNAVAVLNAGRIRGIFAKTHLAREGIHYEPRWFRPWPSGLQRNVTIDGELVPLGTYIYNAAGLNFSLEICEDAWVAPEHRPCRLVQEAQWIFNTSASHFSLGKADIRENLVADSSRRFKLNYAYANLVGCESGRAIYDGELLIAENGLITNRSNRLYMDDYLLLPHDITYEPGHNVASVKLDLTAAPDDLPPIQPNRYRKKPEPEEELAMAASLALFDYMRKSRSRGFTLSLSGGVDSSSVAVLVYITAKRILDELDYETRTDKLAYFKGLDLTGNDARALTNQLLTTVYQGTRNSGEVTRRAAAKLAEALGARHLEFDVDELVEGYKQTVSNALGRELTWERDDIALQNIQARTRGPGVWMLANISGSLLLSTSNRSEVAVGYATMDGDTCGGLAPIAGVEKSFLRHWLVIMEKCGLAFIGAIPELAYVNNQEPTAELRPPERSQKDEDDLMPYEVLDGLEAALIAQRRKPLDAFETVCGMMAKKYGRERIYHWTRRFCRLFAFSQWKRERYAPAFHLDDRNLDPKTWARYPILSGAFEAELEELDAHVARTRGTD
ncbi:MAG: NAD(+) synthase [Acidobacteriota bacterium]|nr:NAD(+) synthase [Acidobacteriota bacterium]